MPQLLLSSRKLAAATMVLTLMLSARCFAGAPPPPPPPVHISAPPPKPPVVLRPAPLPVPSAPAPIARPLPQAQLPRVAVPERSDPSPTAVRPQLAPSQSNSPMSATGQNDVPFAGSSAAKAGSAAPSSPDKPDPPPASARLKPVVQQQADKRVAADKPDAAQASEPADSTRQSQQAGAAKPSSQDNASQPPAGTRQDLGLGTRQTANPPSQTGDDAQPSAAAPPAQSSGDETRLATLIVQRDRADAQFRQEVSAIQAKYADGQDPISYQRARRTADDTYARRLGPILQQMAQLNRTGIDSRKLRLKDLARLAARTLAPVYTPPRRDDCDLANTDARGPRLPAAATARHQSCGYDNRGNRVAGTGTGTRNVAR